MPPTPVPMTTAHRSGSAPTSPASATASAAASPTPATRPCQNDATSCPATFFTPVPVMATRWRPAWSSAVAVTTARSESRSGPARSARSSLPLRGPLGPRDVELLLEGHDELDEVEAVGVEVLLEPCVLGDDVGLDAQHLDRRLLD